MDEKSAWPPGSDLPGIKRAEETAVEVKALGKELTEFKKSVSETNTRFGVRIGALEGHNLVQDEQLRQIQQTQREIKENISTGQKEQKEAIGEFKAEYRESMKELKGSNKEILDALSPLTHKMERLDNLEEDVEELKGKSGKTWEDIKSKAIGWVLLLVLGIVAVALGLEKYL